VASPVELCAIDPGRQQHFDGAWRDRITRQLKPRRQHADNWRRPLVDDQCLAQHIGIAPEPPKPSSVG
jgi:hypothetical protein